MKKLKRTALAVIALTMAAASARAQSTVTVNFGDLVLGFRNTGAQGSGQSSNLEVNLGSFANFANASSTIDLAGSTGLAVQDLINTYGATWNTNAGLLWSVGSTSDGSGVGGLSDNSLFVTSTGTVFKRQTSALQQTVSDNITNFTNSLNGTTSTTNSSVSSVVDASGSASYTGGISGGGTFTRPYAASSTSLMTFATVENNTNIPAGSFVGLNLEELFPTASGTANGTILGQFRLFSNGDLQFVPAAIPEPSTITLLCLGGLCAAGAVIRRCRVAR